MLWYRIVEWFKDRSNRKRLVANFNDSAKKSFILGVAPVLLNATISRGDSKFKHAFSDWLNSGFRIKAMSGRQLTKDEMKATNNSSQQDNGTTLEKTELISKGNIGITSSAQLLKEWREVLINMDKIIIDNLIKISFIINDFRFYLISNLLVLFI